MRKLAGVLFFSILFWAGFGYSQTAIISLSPDSLMFSATQGGSSTTNQVLEVRNIGSGSMPWAFASGYPTWLSLIPTVGSGPMDVQMAAITGSLPPNTYRYVLKAFSGGSMDSVIIRFTVNPVLTAIIALSPDSLIFSAVQGSPATPASQALQVLNNGTGAMSWTFAPGIPAWLSAIPGTASGPTTVQVSAVTGSLPPGLYRYVLKSFSAQAINSFDSVVIRFTVSPQLTAVIALSPDSLIFSATQGGAATPASLALQVQNNGTGAMSWTFAPGIPAWLSAIPGSASGPTTVQVSAVTGSLPPGIYTYFLKAVSGQAINSADSVFVRFTVNPQLTAVISLSPDTLRFNATQGGSPTPNQTLQIRNTGTGVMNWTFAPGYPTWLSLIPTTGAAPTDVPVAAVPGSLPPGTYSHVLKAFSSQAINSVDSVIIIFEVSTPPVPVLEVSTTSMIFNAVQGQGDPSSQLLSIFNSGPPGSTLNWNLTSDQTWLFPANASGQNTGNLNVSVSITNLSVGPHTGHFTITASGANGSPKSVTVTLNISAPAIFISASPGSFSFVGSEGGSNPAAQNLSVTATNQALSWNITKAQNQPWLSASPASGNGNDTVSISVNLAGLTPGNYFDTLIINASAASNAPLRLLAQLVVGPAPAPASLVVSQDSLEFSAQHNQILPPQMIDISNGGQLPLNWTATKLGGSPWLTVNPPSGTDGGQITVTVATDLAPSSYRDTIKIEAPGAANSPRFIPVILRVSLDVNGGPGNLPKSFALFQNYPNPFNPSTEISFVLPRSEQTTLEVFNIVGQRIRVLVDGEMSAGKHSVTWDGRDASGLLSASGIYFYRLKSANFFDIKRMVFLK